MKKNRFLYIVQFFLFASCESFVEVDIPPNQLSTDNVFSDETAAKSASAGIYSGMGLLNYHLSAQMHIATSLNADELVFTGVNQNLRYDQFLASSIEPNNNLISELWNQVYSSIYNVNAAIEGLSNSSIGEEVRKQLLGEAYFMRSLYYFYLVNLYGDVPLVLETDYQATSSLARTDIREVYVQINKDLDSSKVFFENQPLDKNRPSLLSALALQSRIALYLKEWSKAEQLSSEIIQSEKFSLTKTESTFENGSQETIWQLLPSYPGYNTILGWQLIPSSFDDNTIPDFYCSEELVSLFDDDDSRKTSWFRKKIVNELTYYVPYKYQISTATSIQESLVIFRLAEQYLIRGEARIHLGNFDGAKDDLMIIRQRANLFVPPMLNDLEGGLSEIASERRREFFLEWGHRWFDLKRTERSNEVLRPIKGMNWQATDVLWPIPLSQIESNSALTQNAGY